MPKAGPSHTLLAAAALALALGLGLHRPAQALPSYYQQDQARNPAATQWAPKRFGFMPPPQTLPGTKKAHHKCIPNGQARCIARPNRPNPFVLHSGMASSDRPTRSGMTASPAVKTFNYDEYLGN